MRRLTSPIHTGSHRQAATSSRRPRQVVLVALAAIAAVLLGTASSCDPKDTSPQASESAARQSSYERLAKAQPAHTMSYSPSRATINFWIDKWGKQPNKLAYVYLQNAQGTLIGYYVFRGLPVSYCAALTPTYERKDVGDANGADAIVPAPGVDGVYYSGGQCAQYFGIDASTNSYIEFGAGLGINMLVYERPLPQQDVKALGFTTTDDVAKK